MYNIAIIGLSNTLKENDKILLDKNIKILEQNVWKVFVDELITLSSDSYQIASMKDKADHFNRILEQNFDAVFFVKGWFSAHSIIPHIIVKKQIKTKFFGFSDYASILCHLNIQYGFDTYYWIDGLYWIQENLWRIQQILGGTYRLDMSDFFKIKNWSKDFHGKLIGWVVETIIPYILLNRIDLKNKVLYLESINWLSHLEGIFYYLKRYPGFSDLSWLILGYPDFLKDWNSTYSIDENWLVRYFVERWRNIKEIVSDIFDDLDFSVFLTNKLWHWAANLLFRNGFDV